MGFELQDKSTRTMSTFWDHDRNHNSHDVESIATESSSIANNESECSIMNEMDPAKRESRAVLQWRLFFFVTLMLSLLGAVIALCLRVRRADISAFEEAFRKEGRAVLESVGDSMISSLGGMSALTTDVVSHAWDSNQTWPFVTMPDFYSNVRKTLAVSELLFVAINPVVTAAQRSYWENYARRNRYWVDETIDAMAMDPYYHGRIIRNWRPMDIIFSTEGPLPYDYT